MRLVLVFIVFGIIITCCTSKPLRLNLSDVELVEVYQGFNKNKLQMKEGSHSKVIEELNNSEIISPVKYKKTHSILIHYSDKRIDTIYTNGKIHFFKNYYKTDNDLVEMYTVK